MAVVTDSLQIYWNGSDGLHSGNLRNLAPSTPYPTRTAAVVGATFNPTTLTLTLDGIDDHLIFTGAAPFNTKQSHTFEYVIETIAVTNGRYYEQMGGNAYQGIWVDGATSDHYHEHYYGTTDLDVLGHSTVFAGLATPQKLHIVYRYNNATKKIDTFINNQLLNTLTAGGSQSISVTWGTGNVQFGGGYYDAGIPQRFLAMRYYNKALTNTEITQNFNNAGAIGLTAPLVKAGTFKAQTGDLIPVYDLTGHETEPFRFWLGDKKVFIPLVQITDPAASRVRFQTPVGLRAWKK